MADSNGPKGFNPPRFKLPEQKAEMVEYLDENGYVVVAGVADSNQLAQGHDLFWKWIENIKQKSENKFDLKREDPSTWGDSNWPGNPCTGIISSYSFGQSDFCWHSRLLPQVQEAFSSIWEDDNLVVSFDGGNAFRPWRYDPSWITKGGWWHVDQNSYNRPHRQGKVCVQGLLIYCDANEESGGLSVIPKSHLQHDELCERRELQAGDFLPLNKEDPILDMEKVILYAKAGDLLLWDSRTVHCNSPAPAFQTLDEKENSTHKNDELIRLVSYICMLPKSTCNADTLRKRIELYEQGATKSHWPTDVSAAVEEESKYYEAPKEISLEKRELIGYDTEIHSSNLTKMSAIPPFDDRKSITREDVEFYQKGRAFVLDNLLSPLECDHLIKEGEAIIIPPIDYSKGYKIEYRNNDRLVFFSPELAQQVWERVSDMFGEIVVTPENKAGFGVTLNMEGTWKPTGLNSVFRLCKYHPGGHFAPHYDGHHLNTTSNRSLKTFMMYLNGDMGGGCTNWVDESQMLHQDKESGLFKAEEKNILGGIKPIPGRALIFDHHILHEGGVLESGVKYILRSEVMYTQTKKRELHPMEEKAMKLLEEAVRLEENKEAMKAMECYRRAFKMWPPLEEVCT